MGGLRRLEAALKNHGHHEVFIVVAEAHLVRHARGARLPWLLTEDELRLRVSLMLPRGRFLLCAPRSTPHSAGLVRGRLVCLLLAASS